VNANLSHPHAIVTRSRGLSAIYLPPFCPVPDEFDHAGPAVLVCAEDEPLVTVTRSCGLGSEYRDRILLVADAPRMRRAIRERQSVDPYLFRMAQALRCGFRRGVLPPPAYLDIIAGPLADHLELNYARPLRDRERKGLSESRLARALAFIDAQLPGEVPMDQLAAAACLSPFHFGRMFKRSTGLAPHEFVNLCRFARASELLASTKLPIAAVGRSVGYGNPSHFTTAFRRLAGQTPSRYRRARLLRQSAGR
jgi:AraC-like DNA-binding protein